jgi:putative intracellular protease/amidase
MDEEDNLLQIANLLFPGVTALDAVGPREVLSRIPNTEIRFVGKETGPVVTEGDVLLLGVTHTVGETMSPDLVLVTGGATTPGQMVDDEVLELVAFASYRTWSLVSPPVQCSLFCGSVLDCSPHVL